LACFAEGQAHRKLVRSSEDNPKYARALEDLECSLDRQQQLESLRASVPLRAKVSQTSLAGKLQRHLQEYKCVIDTLRVGLANAESELAIRLAKHLQRPREAKKTLANLLAAPGRVRVDRRHVTVRLLPAGTAAERRAFRRFLADVNRLELRLPGNLSHLPLRFQCANR
jgi:hypothetical protein